MLQSSKGGSTHTPEKTVVLGIPMNTRGNGNLEKGERGGRRAVCGRNKFSSDSLADGREDEKLLPEAVALCEAPDRLVGRIEDTAPRATWRGNVTSIDLFAACANYSG